MKCPVCANRKNKYINSYKRYKLYQCSQCDLIFCNPFRNPGNKFYEEFYRDIDCHNPARYGLNPSQELFLRQNRPGKLLDVGCGVGTLIAAAKIRGFRVTGFDFDGKALDIAKDYFGLKNVYSLDINDQNIEKFGKFDYVTLIDVLEHVDNPNEMITGCLNTLKKGGKLIISVPNYKRKPDFIFKAGDNPPHHLTKWTTKSLKYLLEQNGFKIETLRPLEFTSHDFYMFVKVNTFDRFKRMLPRSKNNNVNQRRNISISEQYRPNLMNKFIYSIRNLIVVFFEILFFIPTLFSITFLRFESDHLYVEAKKI